ncbi:MAG: ABC transporter substrate-binding protein [Conexibacteraceae bacterium]|nr:ABC transporter substrate-binding protein [Conexibacteraceae bacterium]
MKRFNWLLAAPIACVAMAAFGGTALAGGTTGSAAAGSGAPTGKVGGKIVIDNESGATWSCQFNPLNPADFGAGTTFGLMYEPLMYVNILQSTAAPKPMLATADAWSHGFKTLTFTIRSGVKWTDGTAFSAKDVVYTFNAIKSDKALDINSLFTNDGGPIESVTAKGSDKVVFKFNAPAQTYFYYVADQTAIVPQHIWSKLSQSKLATYTDTKPVGTGPYTLGSCSAQNIKYERNAHYWQSKPSHPVPMIQEIDYPSFLSNTSANLQLQQGLAQWGGQYIPNVNSFYIKGNPSRHIWYPPTQNVALVPNLDNALLKQLPVRQAILAALNKKQISALGEGGEEQAANQTAVVTPTFSAWADTSIKQPSYNTANAKEILKRAGFTKNGSGIYAKNGQALSFTIKTITGYSDWDASLQIITQELKAAGIQVTVQDEASNTYQSDLQGGNFQLAYAGSGGPAAISPGPSPYYELRGWLLSHNIGSTNYERYKNPATDNLLNSYASANAAGQKHIIDQVQKLMVSDIPFIPVTEGVDWFQYDTTKVGGWPTASDPYAQPSPYSSPDNGQVVAHLYPTK